MSKIKTLQAEKRMTEHQLKAAQAPFLNAIKDLECEINIEYFKTFAKNKELKALVAKLESSRNFCLDESGELMTWERIDLTTIEDDAAALDALDSWLSEQHGAYLDRKNECVQCFQGGYIGINEDGDVYSTDCGKTDFFLSRRDYESVEERNEKIEAYMERTGVYPGVFKVGHYGDLCAINTQKEAKKT